MLDSLCELIGGDKSALMELIETFLDESQTIIDEMKSSVPAKDLDTLRRGAHSMKSSSQDFGAIELSELNATLESQCKNGWPANAEEQVSDISTHYQQAKDALISYLNDQ
jgi:HPt (histidine-containing phosphotransfer) domain-containing protein